MKPCGLCAIGEPRSDDGEHFWGGDLYACRDFSAEPREAAPEDWANLPTKADVQSQSRRAAQAQRAAALAAYRTFHPEARGSDAKMEALMQIEAIGRPSGGATALDSRGGPATRQEPK